MKRADWVKKLEKKLKNLPKEETDSVIAYYAEIYDDRISDGQDEEDIIESFGTPDDIGEKIISDYNAYLQREEVTTASLSDDEQEPEKTQEPEEPAEDEEWTKNYEVHDFSSLSLTRLNVSAKSSSVTVRKGKRFRLFIKSDDGGRFNITTSGNTLSVQEKTTSVWQNFGIGLASKDMIVEVSQLDEINIDAMRGSNISGMALKRLVCKSMSGDIVITDCSADTQLALSSSGGGITVDGVRFGLGSIGTTDGDITVTKVQAKNISITTVSGQVQLDDITTAEMIKVKAVGGDIRGGHLSGGTVDLKTILELSGKPADYKIYTSTLFGRVSAPSGGASGMKVYTATVSGAVEITATEN